MHHSTKDLAKLTIDVRDGKISREEFFGWADMLSRSVPRQELSEVLEFAGLSQALEIYENSKEHQRLLELSEKFETHEIVTRRLF